MLVGIHQHPADECPEKVARQRRATRLAGYLRTLSDPGRTTPGYLQRGRFRAWLRAPIGRLDFKTGSCHAYNVAAISVRRKSLGAESADERAAER